MRRKVGPTSPDSCTCPPGTRMTRGELLRLAGEFFRTQKKRAVTVVCKRCFGFITVRAPNGLDRHVR